MYAESAFFTRYVKPVLFGSCMLTGKAAGPKGARPGLVRVGADILKWEPLEKYDVVFGFPPCTDLASSGARWWKKKELDNPGTLERALALFDRAREIASSQTTVWFLENPVGRLATFRGKPNYSFNPCDYGGYLTPAGDAYTKKTCLWTGSGFVMPPKKPVNPTEGSKMHFISPGPERANLRSATPMGFARAVYLFNSRPRT